MLGRRIGAIVFVGMLVIFAPCAFGAEAIAVESLLDEMVDLSVLAELPDPPFTCRQFSSYDRRSKTPDDHDAWFANGDRGKYLSVEEREGRKEFVMMDAEGPGCVVRIWSANPGGDFRIYIDGSEKPALEMAMQDAMGGARWPFLSPYAGVRARGWNIHFPIPYAKRCKVTTTDGNIYYHVNYRTYPAGTAVRSFSIKQCKALEGKIEKIRTLLERPYTSNLPPEGSTLQKINLMRLAPGAAKVIADLKGPAAVWELEAALDVGDWRQELRHTILQITFDGEKEPSVLCPLGDFFGSSPDINPYQSLPIRMHRSGEMSAKWLMPFEKSCKIVLKNEGAKSVGLWGSVRTIPYRWTDRSLRFHAKWRAQNNMPSRPFHDWSILKCRGKGTFVGCMLSVCNPVKGWWGEGDEKIYVDGEKFPSHFGTGSEDYFGYAWCNTDLFIHAYHNQTRCDGPGNYGLTSVNRFHIFDQIPFTKEFQIDIEAWHSNDKTTVSYSATGYWYARPGGSDFYQPLSKEMLKVIEPTPLPKAPKVQGALEGEELRVVQKTGGETEVQGGFDEIWSGEKQLWWKHANPGQVLIVAFPVKQGGRYKVFGNFTRAVDYGIMQLSINDQKAGNPMDFFGKAVTATGRRELGTFELGVGDNLLKAEVVGKHDKAVPSYMFGLDYLLLEKVD